MSDTDNRLEYVLSEMRAAVLRAKLWQADIEAIGIALKGGAITVEQALEELRHTGCLHLVGPVREQAMEALK